VLLDTHVWIWLVTDTPGRLGPRTRRRLAKTGAGDPLHVSTISVLEIAALHVAGRLLFTQPVERWIRESMAKAGFRVVDSGIAASAPPRANIRCRWSRATGGFSTTRRVPGW
jgi:PIN domain nuclease of toxin-antitoxin system